MSIEAMKQAYEVPLVEQLESVPNNARLVIDDADGMGTRYIPVGRMCHDASKALRQAIAEASQNGLYREGYRNGYGFGEAAGKRQAIAEAEKQEPVGWIDSKGNMICTKINESCKPLYTTPHHNSASR